jgi:uncharacterized protein YfdQ (DUF2303 family)
MISEHLCDLVNWIRDSLQKPKERYVDLQMEGVPPVVILQQGETETLAAPTLAIEWADKWRLAHAPGPDFRKGMAIHEELGSFIAHVNRQKSEDSTIWAEFGRMRLLCVFDYHPEGGDVADAAHGRHRAVYVCHKASEWLAWAEIDGKFMSQDAFSDFVEQRLEDLTSGEKGETMPSPASILELARDLKVYATGRFERKIDPTTGSSSLVCKNENDSLSSTPIPKCFLLGIPIFEGGERYRVEARLRMRLCNGAAQFAVILHRRVELERAAFDDVAKIAREKTELPVFQGVPEMAGGEQ